ncbi:MAG: tetratricopeptide repeat protein [Elusimicrobia bacterium]|nr:tetratricopeptide repeat protein [Elusimicrobiota bacterium]
MRIYVLIVLSLWGAYYYATRKVQFKFHDSLEYAKKNPQAKWAPSLDYYVGMAYYQRSEYPQAQEAFTQLLTDYPTSQYAPKALLYLAEVAERNSDWEAAKAALSRFIDKNPDNPKAETMKKKLELIKYHHP